MSSIALVIVVVVAGAAVLDIVLLLRVTSPRRSAELEQSIQTELVGYGLPRDEARRIVEGGRPSVRRRLLFWILFGVFLSPVVVGLLSTASLNWRIRTLPEFLMILSFGIFLIAALTRFARGQATYTAGSFSASHPRVMLGLSALVTAGVLGFGAVLGADFLVPFDQQQVFIQSVNYGRFGESIKTDQGRFQTALFWAPGTGSGKARLTVGHFSRQVVRIEPFDELAP